MRFVRVAPLLASLGVLAACAGARPAAANVFVDLGVSTSSSNGYTSQASVSQGTKVFFLLRVLNSYSIPVAAKVEIPLLHVSKFANLSSGNIGSLVVPIVAKTAGTHNVTAIVLYRNPATGRVWEVWDTVQVVISALGDDTGGGKKDDTGTLGGQQQSGNQGQQSGSQSQQSGSGDKKDGTGTLGDKKDTGTSGGQQQGGGQQQSGGQQQGGSGDKKDGTGTLGDKKDTGTSGGQQQSGSQGQQSGNQGGKKDSNGTLNGSEIPDTNSDYIL